MSRKTLFVLMILVAVIYFGIEPAEQYWRFVRFRDEMRQQALVAHCVPDDAIERRLLGKADELGIPVEAADIVVDREPAVEIVISASYEVPIQLPGFVKIVHFEPSARQRL